MRPIGSGKAHVIEAEALFRRGAARRLIGPQEPIPDDEVVAEVTVRWSEITRVVPAVELGAREHDVQSTVPQIQIGVLKQATGAGEHRQLREQVGARPEHDERRRLSEHRGDDVEGVISPRAKHIELGRAVMERVYTPQ